MNSVSGSFTVSIYNVNTEIMPSRHRLMVRHRTPDRHICSRVEYNLLHEGLMAGEWKQIKLLLSDVKVTHCRSAARGREVKKAALRVPTGRRERGMNHRKSVPLIQHFGQSESHKKKILQIKAKEKKNRDDQMQTAVCESKRRCNQVKLQLVAHQCSVTHVRLNVLRVGVSDISDVPIVRL